MRQGKAWVKGQARRLDKGMSNFRGEGIRRTMTEQNKIEINHVGGVGSFFYGLIPGVLGGAALLWLAFVTGCLDLQQQRTFASRMDNRVGVVKPLTADVKLIIERNSCATVDRAFIDGDTVTAYLKNGCHDGGSYMEWHIDAAAPDGTVIQTWWTNETDRPPFGKAVEVKHEMTEDNRITDITVWASSDHH